MSNLSPVPLNFKYLDSNVQKTFEDFQSVTNYLISRVHIGSGNPEGNEAGTTGDIYLRTDGSDSLYSKQSGTDSTTGWVLIGTGGGTAPIDASYVTLGLNSVLTNERVLTAGSNITLTDNGAGSTVVISSTGGSPANPSTSIQFNNSGAFGGSANLEWDGSAVGITGDINFRIGGNRGIIFLDQTATDTNADLSYIQCSNSVTGTGSGGDFLLYAGNSGDSGTAGGSIAYISGSNSISGTSPGEFIIYGAGANGGSGDGGSIYLTAGDSDSATWSGTSGVFLDAGNVGTNSGSSLVLYAGNGDAQLAAGSSDDTTTGGSVSIIAQSSNGTGTGGDVIIDTGAGSLSTDGSPSSVNDGNIYIHFGKHTPMTSGLSHSIFFDGWSNRAEEIPAVKFVNGTTGLQSGVTIADQRFFQFIAPTINGVAGGGAETVTRCATVYISDAPSGSNITITNPYSLWVDAGLARFDGNGTVVFELPADATDPTGGGGAAAGRIPIKVGGATKYLAYY